MNETTIAVEGNLDQAILSRILSGQGWKVGKVYGLTGKAYLEKHIGAFNNAAKSQPWVVLTDLDQVGCAPELRDRWLDSPSRFLCFRIAVREVEAWLMADRFGLAKFLKVKVDDVPDEPDNLLDPKSSLLEIVAKSRSKRMRRELLARPGSYRSQGPEYNTRLIEFVESQWDVKEASQHSASLHGAIERIGTLRERWEDWLQGKGQR